MNANDNPSKHSPEDADSPSASGIPPQKTSPRGSDGTPNNRITPKKSRRLKVGAVVVIVIVVLGLAAALLGPKIYAKMQAGKTVAAPTLSVSAQPGGTAATDNANALGSLSGTAKVAEGSQAGYEVAEVLQGENVTVRGLTDQVSGQARLREGRMESASVDVDLASVRTDSDRRDGYFRDTALNVSEYPSARFELTQPLQLTPQPTAGTTGENGDASPAPATTNGAQTVKFTGKLTIHGVSRDVTGSAQVAMQGGDLRFVGSVPITFADFGVQAPSLGFVKVDDQGKIEFGLTLRMS